MDALHALHRPPYRLIVLFLLLLWCVPYSVLAQTETTPQLILRPHCTATVDCPSFEVRDPQSLQTALLQATDLLDLDLIIQNPSHTPISRFRMWIGYDPQLLSGASLSINESFPIPTPGESIFSQNDGFLKIGASTTNPVSDETIVLAHVIFRVIPTSVNGTPLIFFDNLETPIPETGIFSDTASEQSLLTAMPGFLFVRFANANSTFSQSSAGSSSLSSYVSVTEDTAQMTTNTENTITGTFELLQVQELRVTTEGSTVYLAWDALTSSELIGYHLYYGTVSGQYIQRRAIDADSQSMSIRSLPIDTTYYFAIRGVRADNTGTDFSREVGVSVGNPRTSTAPFIANTLTTLTPDTDGAIAGETGVSSTLLFLLLFSAMIGTIIAFRRQLVATHAPVLQ